MTLWKRFKRRSAKPDLVSAAYTKGMTSPRRAKTTPDGTVEYWLGGERRVQRIMARSDFIGTFLSLSGCGQTAPTPHSLLTGEGRR